MIFKKKLVLRFTDDFIDLVILIKKNNSIDLTTIRRIKRTSSIGDDNYLNTQILGEVKSSCEDEIKKFIKENKVQDKEAIIILSGDGIITRVIEIPLMNNKELKSYIDNNISEYFTVNVEEYFYDYAVMQMIKKDKKIIVLIVAFEKNKLLSITNIVNKCRIKIDTITVYPYCIYKAFRKHENLSAAVFDISSERINTIILHNNNIFLYSRADLEFQSDKDEIREEILENMVYFLNFYSTRHFGNKVQRIYLIGEESRNEGLLNTVENQFKNEFCKDTMNALNLHVKLDENLDINNYYDIIGSIIEDKKMHNKKINFNKKINKYNEKEYLKDVTLSLIALSMIFFTLSIGYIEYMLKRYDNRFLDKELQENIAVEKEINEEKRLSNELNEKNALLKIIENDKFKYKEYLNIIKTAIPQDISISKITIDREKIYISLNIKGTVDKIRVVNALNSTEVFETVEIDSIKLNNTDTKADFTVKIKSFFNNISEGVLWIKKIVKHLKL